MTEKNYGIVFTAPGVAELLEEPMPSVGEDDVLVRIERTTISAGTERANLLGDPNTNPGKVKPGAPLFPKRLGYSASGVVVQTGKNVTEVKVGDRVACAWSKHLAYWKPKPPREKLYPIPDEVSFADAALIHIATFPLAAIRKCRLEIGESAIVMGQGILGQMAVQLLRAAGATPIIAVDPVPEKRERALELGADFALDPFEAGFAERVKELTGGGARVAIEVTGNGKALDMVLDCMARFGRVALLGCTRNSDFSIDYYRKVHAPGITLVGAHTMARPKEESFEGWWTERDDANAVIRLLVGKRIDFSRLVEEVHAPSEASEVFSRLASEKFFPIVQFDWNL